MIESANRDWLRSFYIAGGFGLVGTALAIKFRTGMSSMLINSLLVAGWGAAIYLSWKLFRDIFTPLCIYASVWFACILLFRLRLVDYYELESRTSLLIGSSIGAFVLGCVIGRLGRRSCEDVGDLSGVLQPDRVELVIKALLVLNFVGVLIFAYRMNSAYGLGTYITDPGAIRGGFDEWGRVGLLALLMLLDYPLLACSCVYHLLTKKWRWFSVLGVLLPSLQTVLKTDRGTLTIYVITCLFLWIYWNRWRGLNWRIVREVSIIATLLLAYFLAMGLLLGKTASDQMKSRVFSALDLNVTSQVGLALANPYIYATGSLPGFQEAIADVDRLSWGTHTFFPVARILYGVGILSERPEGFTFDFYRVPIPVNTYTHLIAYYQDFGVAGLILLPLILGYLETRLYVRMKACPSLFSLGGSSALAALNAFSVFIPLITSLAFWYYFATLCGISRFCRSSGPAFQCERGWESGEAALCP